MGSRLIFYLCPSLIVSLFRSTMTRYFPTRNLKYGEPYALQLLQVGQGVATDSFDGCNDPQNYLAR